MSSPDVRDVENNIQDNTFILYFYEVKHEKVQNSHIFYIFC